MKRIVLLCLVVAVCLVCRADGVVSSNSTIVSVSTFAKTNPPPPVVLNPPGNLQAVYTNGVIVLTWLNTNGTNVNQHFILRGGVSTNLSTYATAVMPSLTYTDTFVVANTNYTYAVQASQ